MWIRLIGIYHSLCCNIQNKGCLDTFQYSKSLLQVSNLMKINVQIKVVKKYQAEYILTPDLRNMIVELK